MNQEEELKKDIEIISGEITLSREEVETPMLEIYDRTKKVLTKLTSGILQDQGNVFNLVDQL